MKIEYSNMLVELDCILDTRISTILSIIGDDQERFEKILTEGYFDRVCDKFPTISHQEFKEAYAKRDRNTLRNAQVTKLIYFIKEFALKTLTQSYASPFQAIPKITINIYPYALHRAEIDVILKAVRTLMGDRCELEAIRMAPEQITPKMIKDTYTVVVMYDYPRWLDYHAGNNGFTSDALMPGIGFIAPCISFLDVEPKDLIGEDNPFITVMRATAPFIALALYPVDMFCLVTDLNAIQKEIKEMTAKEA